MHPFHLCVHPKWSGINFAQPFLTIFVSKRAHFQGILGFLEHQRATTSLKGLNPLVLASHVI